MRVLALLTPVTEQVLSAGEILAMEWTRPGGPRGHVDKADIDAEIESVLRKGLLNILDCDFWGEETGVHMTGDDYCWVVDPNDGTSDFLQGRMGSAISVGLLHKNLPVLGVVYAPVTPGRGPDCISWAEGAEDIVRNGHPVRSRLDHLDLDSDGQVMVSTAATSKPDLNAELCMPASFVPMPSIAYRIARVAAGDGVAAASLVPVSAHDVVGGHALLIGAKGVLLDEKGQFVTYDTAARMAKVSERCFGGAPKACQQLVGRDWGKLLSRS